MNESTLYLVRSPIGPSELEAIDRVATVAVYGQAAASAFTSSMRERLVRRRHMALTGGSGRMGSAAAAVGLLSDFFALSSEGLLDLADDDADAAPDILAGLSWRIGRRMIGLLSLKGEVLAAAEALEAGAVDALVPAGQDSLEWLQGWLAHRSLIALQSSASLIRRRAGDVLERAEFARLFAAGVPQQGLDSFLMKRTPAFAERVRVETI